LDSATLALVLVIKGGFAGCSVRCVPSSDTRLDFIGVDSEVE
jgi:hypothetical protein